MYFTDADGERVKRIDDDELLSAAAGPSSSSSSAFKPPPLPAVEKKTPSTSVLGIKRKDNDSKERKNKIVKTEGPSIPIAKKALLAIDYGSSSDDD